MRKVLLAAALALAPALAAAQGMGYGAGMGMGYGRGGLAALELSDAQAEKVFAIQEAGRQKNWATMSKMRAEMFKLQRLYNNDKADPKAVTEQQKKVDELRRDMLQARLETRKQVETVLTPEQRKQLRQYGPWWLHDEE
jgi:Spy/CpxP family protein refolding chaperone